MCHQRSTFLQRALLGLTLTTGLAVLIFGGMTFFQKSGLGYTKGDVAQLHRQEALLQDIHSSHSQQVVDGPTIKIVCPEHYDVPKVKKSNSKWVTETCDYALPVSDLVTVILVPKFPPNLESHNHRMSTENLVAIVKRRLPSVPIIVPLDGGDSVRDSGTVRYVEVPSNATSGDVWNALVGVCNTPYALLATNVLNFTLDLMAMQRLLRVVSETEGTQVVGGATRNATGHWRTGCYQVVLKNYVLRYRKGYRESLTECMRCDFVDGPFLAETLLLRAIPMNRKLPAAMLLPDFFLRVFEKQSSLLCPDVMMDAEELLTSPAAAARSTWLNMATDRQLNRIHIRFPRSAILHRFNCSELKLECQSMHGTKTLPPCCQEKFARVIGFWAKFAKDNGINYQFLSGSILGAVKMEDMMPWDIDGDIFFDEANYSFIKSSVATFEKSGIRLTNFQNPTEGSAGYMQMTFSGFFVEMYAVHLHMDNAVEGIFPDDTAPSGANPFNRTRVEIHGVWVNAPPNPGLYARGRYGKEILKHAMSWRQNGKKSGWEPYDYAGHFTSTCENPGHHACLNAMPADGSIFYNIPEY